MPKGMTKKVMGMCNGMKWLKSVFFLLKIYFQPIYSYFTFQIL